MFFGACDRMTDNGVLDGMWQLTSVAYKGGEGVDSIVNMRGKGVYFSFQKKLAQITPGEFQTDSTGERILMRFKKSSGALQLYDFHTFIEEVGPIGTERHSVEKLLTDSASTLLQPFGINGISAGFDIEKLNGDAMILQSTYARLIFRKY